MSFLFNRPSGRWPLRHRPRRARTTKNSVGSGGSENLPEWCGQALCANPVRLIVVAGRGGRASLSPTRQKDRAALAAHHQPRRQIRTRDDRAGIWATWKEANGGVAGVSPAEGVGRDSEAARTQGEASPCPARSQLASAYLSDTVPTWNGPPRNRARLSAT